MPKSAFFTSIISQKFGTIFLELGSIISNQLAKIFFMKDGNLIAQNEFYSDGNNKVWVWRQTHYNQLITPTLSQDPLTFTIYKIYRLFKSFLAYAIISLIFSFGLHICMVSIVILYILAVRLLHWIFRTAYNPSLIYEQFPWIGALGAYLARKGKSDKYVLWAYFGFLCFSYLFYCVAYYLWSEEFSRESPHLSQHNGNYVYNVLFTELSLMIFCRTRITIKYLPKLLTVFNGLYIFYMYSYFFIPLNSALYLLISVSILTLIIFLVLFEQPALSWDDNDKFKPNNNNPRQGYMLVPLMNFSFGFDLWTIFYPPAFRTEFRENEQTHIATNIEMLQYDFSTNLVAGVGNGPEDLLVMPGNNIPERQNNSNNRLVEMQEHVNEHLNEV